MIHIPLTIISYTDSTFTNPHELVSDNPPVVYNQHYSHLGLVMDGLESKRHLNVQYEDGMISRLSNRTNTLILRLDKPSLVHQIIFDTSFFTSNHVNMVYETTFIYGMRHIRFIPFLYKGILLKFGH
eukprot:TRINITY_DN2744_c0_g2_i1.p2 TRINITY_DN2744_c0_g2~~TRINITY_DN2744_c0_g2_i1.p2  ORF type:complete len:127 (-),score=12.56 TRINITY_DN2744_c0_g2_i1:686-1066(-)